MTITDGTTHTATTTHLVEVIRHAMPEHSWPFWFDGWPGDIEAALLDAVFSARATYGGPTTGVRKVVDAWRRARDGAVDDLGAVAAVPPDDLVDILGNRQRVSGNRTTKAEAVHACATGLVEHGVRTSADLAGLDPQHLERVRDVALAVPGFGTASWEVFACLSGAAEATVDRMVGEFVDSAAAPDGTVSTPGEASPDAHRAAIIEAAELLGVSEGTLRHSIWRYRRRLERLG